MAKKMKITVEISDDDGNEIVKSTRQRELPFVEEFDKQGFDKSFDQIETAVLEARKEASDEAVSIYMEEVSKKNRNDKSKEELWHSERIKKALWYRIGAWHIKHHHTSDNQERR